MVGKHLTTELYPQPKTLTFFRLIYSLTLSIILSIYLSIYQLGPKIFLGGREGKVFEDVDLQTVL
jgi:hypothetical protein